MFKVNVGVDGYTYHIFTESYRLSLFEKRPFSSIKKSTWLHQIEIDTCLRSSVLTVNYHAVDAKPASTGEMSLNGVAREKGPSKEEKPFESSTLPSVPFGWSKQQQSSPSNPPIPAFLLQRQLNSGQNKAPAPFSFGQAAQSKGEKRKGNKTYLLFSNLPHMKGEDLEAGCTITADEAKATALASCCHT